MNSLKILRPRLCTRTIAASPITASSSTTTNQSVNNQIRICRPAHSFFSTTRTMAAHGDLHIENVNIKTATGVELSAAQKTIVGSVLDLFAGRPSLAKLQLWAEDGEFEDPIAIAKGRKEFEPQWYGLQTAFSEIERISHQVNSAGNPITMDLKQRYVVKGIGKEQVVTSVVNIFVNDAGKISKVQDKWNGELPEGSIRNAFRRLNASTMPHIVSVPKSAAEDQERGN